MDFSVLESMPDATVIVDDGSIVFLNEEAELLFGYPRLELMGRPVEVLVPVRFREAHRAERAGYTAAPRRRPMGLGLDLFGLKKNGQEFPAEISLSPMQVGDKTYTVAAIRDATERNRAREELRRRDELLFVASHELRGPAGTIQLLITSLNRAAGLTSVDLQKVVKRMGILERQAAYLTQLATELLDVSQIHLGRLQLKLEETDLAEVTRDVAERMREEVEHTGSALVVRAEQPALGRWDALRLQQVIANLLGNAAKFGEGKPIEVHVDADDARARLVVQDHGPGVPTEDQERIFELFGRAVAASAIAGFGLGLYLSRLIVEAHHGVIHLDSQPNSGSTFTVELPRA